MSKVQSKVQELFVIVALGLILCSLPLRARQTGSDASWKTKLFQQSAAPDTTEFARTHAEEAYALVREGWSVAKPFDKTGALDLLIRTGNPHWLDALDLSMDDSDHNVRHAALDHLKSFAFQVFPEKTEGKDASLRHKTLPSDGGKAYAQWRKHVAGKSPEDVIRMEETALLQKIAAVSDPGERNSLLWRLVSADFWFQNPYAQLRRKIAAEYQTLALLERLASPPDQATETMMQAIWMLRPDENYLRRMVLPVTAAGKTAAIRAAALDTLSQLRSPMAAEVLTRRLLQGAAGDPQYLLAQSIMNSADPRLIPIYIGSLEADAQCPNANLMHYALGQITGVPGDANHSHDVTWWEGWWKQNRDKYPATVRSIPIPRLKWMPQEVERLKIFPRRLVWREIQNDRLRGYWLGCPQQSPERVGTPAGPVLPPGLIVALPPDGNADAAAPYWLEACRQALHDNYYIAVPAAPRFSPTQTLTWVTAKNRAQVTGAAFTTECFVREIVEDVASEFTLDQQRCYLFGKGESGMAAYACALTESTPFRGFCLLDSNFRSAALPDLQHAKGRRFYIQNTPTDKSVPPWLAAAGGELLRKQGALVKQVSAAGNQEPLSNSGTWQPLRDALAWLNAHK